MFGFIWRKPLIFDFWASVHLSWAVADYYSAASLDTPELSLALASFSANPPPRGKKLITFHRYGVRD